MQVISELSSFEFSKSNQKVAKLEASGDRCYFYASAAIPCVIESLCLVGDYNRFKNLQIKNLQIYGNENELIDCQIDSCEDEGLSNSVNGKIGNCIDDMDSDQLDVQSDEEEYGQQEVLVEISVAGQQMQEVELEIEYESDERSDHL